MLLVHVVRFMFAVVYYLVVLPHHLMHFILVTIFCLKFLLYSIAAINQLITSLDSITTLL
jgi:hypothetical protein